MRSLTPLPSGFVRPRRTGAALAQRFGPAGALIEGIATLCREAVRLVFSSGRTLIRRYRRAQMAHTLVHLSDHTLRDIGLERSKIASAVMEIERGVDPRR